MAISDQVGRDPLTEKVGAWWLEVLSGEQGRDHPIYGSNIHANCEETPLRSPVLLSRSMHSKRLERRS